MGVQVSLSDNKAALIEKKQNEILNEAYGNAKSIIKMNKGLIEHLLIPLQERQKLTKIEVEELINEYQTKNNLKENEAK
jgi:ATP-dependent Zn protease